MSWSGSGSAGSAGGASSWAQPPAHADREAGDAGAAPDPETPGAPGAFPEAEEGSGRSDAGGDAGDAGAPGADEELGILSDLATLQAERDEFLGALQRLQADFENFRKRTQRQLQEQTSRAEANLASKLLPVLDVLDLARTHLASSAEQGPAEAEGDALTQARSLLLDALAKEGLERIDEVEVDFDPVVHDAVAHVPAEPSDDAGDAGGGADGAGSRDAKPGNRVQEVLRAGYLWQGQTLRPAMVKVRG